MLSNLPRLRAIGVQLLMLIFMGTLAYFGKQTFFYWLGLIAVGIIEVFHRQYHGKSYKRLAIFKAKFP